jgi:hypothetical protein
MKSTYIKYAFGLLLLPLSITAFSQEDGAKMSDVEEVVVLDHRSKEQKLQELFRYQLSQAKI